MKKTIAVVCIMAVLASFAGCGKTSENTQSNTAETSVVTTTSISSDSSDTSSEAETTTTTEATTTTTATKTTTAKKKVVTTAKKSAAKATTKKVKSVQTARVAQVTQQTQSPAPAVTTARVTVRKVVVTTAAKTTTAKKKVVTTAKKSTTKNSKILNAYKKWILGTCNQADRDLIVQDAKDYALKCNSKLTIDTDLTAYATSKTEPNKIHDEFDYNFGTASWSISADNRQYYQRYITQSVSWAKIKGYSLEKDVVSFYNENHKAIVEWCGKYKGKINFEMSRDDDYTQPTTHKTTRSYTLEFLSE